jgi:hypothetical protein
MIRRNVHVTLEHINHLNLMIALLGSLNKASGRIEFAVSGEYSYSHFRLGWTNWGRVSSWGYSNFNRMGKDRRGINKAVKILWL